MLSSGGETPYRTQFDITTLRSHVGTTVLLLFALIYIMLHGIIVHAALEEIMVRTHIKTNEISIT